MVMPFALFAPLGLTESGQLRSCMHICVRVLREESQIRLNPKLIPVASKRGASRGALGILGALEHGLNHCVVLLGIRRFALAAIRVREALQEFAQRVCP